MNPSAVANVYLYPFYVVKSGRIGEDNQAIGNYGRIWSSTTCGGGSEGYSFATNFNEIFPVAWELRGGGFSLHG